MPYIEKRILSGKLLEVERYFAARDGRRIPRGSNQEETKEDQQRINERHAQKRLMRLICTNFSRENGDLFLTLTHAKDITEAQAAKEERNLFERLKRARREKGLPELKRICVTEKQGRWHHHLIMNGGLTLEDLQLIWGDRGRIQVSILDESYTYADLAKYLTEQHKPGKQSGAEGNAKQPRQKYQRRWHASRNLLQPTVTRREIKRPPTSKEPTPPKGYRLLPSWRIGCDMFGNLYTYYACVADAPGGRCCGKGLGAAPQRGAGQSPAHGGSKAKGPGGGRTSGGTKGRRGG